ncbi:hypothetical protein FGG78_27265, partial [Thioclava sp. BHET1]
GLLLPKALLKAFDWPAIRSQITVDGVVALADAEAVAAGRFAPNVDAVEAQRAADDSLDHETPLSEVFEDQISCADIILLTKADLAGEAGLAAARRVIDLALPLLEAGQSLRFAVLPAGKDPDDLIKAEGPPAMQAVIDSAMPMVQLLWQRETEGQVFDSPERRAALDKTLRQLISRIQDPSIKTHYGEAIKDLRWELFGSRRREGQSGQGERRSFTPFQRPPGGARRGGGNWPLPQLPPIASTKRSLLVGGDEAVTERLREAVILATLICHPALIHLFEAGFERLEMSTPEYRALQAAILRHADAENLKEILGRELPDALEMLFSLSHLQIAPPILNPDDTAGARQCLEEEMAKLQASRGVLREMKDAAEDLEGLADEGVTWRLSQAAQARNRAGRAMNDDASDLGEDSAALSKHLQSLIDAQIWVKKKG